MWILKFVLGSFLIGSILADVKDELQKCQENINLSMMEDLSIPEQDEMEILCPQMLGFLDCVDDVIEKHTGFKLAELAALSTDPAVQKGATLLSNIRSVFSDLCTEGTALNTAYEEHSSCLSGVDVDAEVCTDNALTAYKTYKAFEGIIEEDDEDFMKRNCLIAAYQSACIASQVHDTCGQGAFEVYQQIVKRTSIFSLALCSEENLETLKTNFLSSLDLDEDRQDLFRLAFDLRKRRR